MNTKIFILTFTLLLGIISIQAQQSLTLYNMDFIGQSTQVNPSLMPANKMYIGIPMLSSTSFLFTNSGFTWRDLHKVRADDSVSFDINNAISKLTDKNFISLSVRFNILEAGFHVKKSYFTLNVSEKMNLNMTFPKDFFELIQKGNGAFIGQEIDLNSMSFDVTHYREYAIGMARQINKKVTLGGRVKYLYGMENFSSAQSHLSFYTAPDDYELVLNSGYTINTSSASNSKNGNSGNYVFGFKNTGLAGDISATYNVRPRWKLNASIIDIGYINWKSNVKNYVTAAGSYKFDGIDISKFLNDSSASMNNVADSISNSFKPKETTDSYKTTLPAHVYMNAAFSINEKTSATALLHGEVFKNTVQPTFTVGLNRRFTNHLSASLNYSMINHHFDNLGAGIVMHAGAFQFYALSDNLIGTINPLSHNTAHIQFGFNLVYGRFKNKKMVTDYGVQKKASPSNTKTLKETEIVPVEVPETEKPK